MNGTSNPHLSRLKILRSTKTRLVPLKSGHVIKLEQFSGPCGRTLSSL